MLASKPCFTPFMSNTKILFEIVDKLQNLNPYIRLIDKLLYLINTRPNISFDVQIISHHQQVAQHVLCYIKANHAHGLFFMLNLKCT